jgi:hypothetical protein
MVFSSLAGISPSSTTAPSSPPRHRSHEDHTSTVTRAKYLELQRQLSTERIIFLRELNTLRMSLEMAQLKESAAASHAINRTTSSMSPNIVGVNSATAADEYASPLTVGGGGLRRFASNVNFGGTAAHGATATYGHVRSNDTTPVVGFGGGASLTSAPSLYFHNVASPVVASPPPLPPPPPPELISMKLLSEALSSAQLFSEMRELHVSELREKDIELEELRDQLTERLREGEAEWHLRFRTVKHEARQHLQTFEQERERVRVEAIASVGDALRHERELVAELRAQTAALQEQVMTLQRTLEDRDTETRSLRVQIGNLQQERVVAGLERNESRGALMAMSSEKIALERRVRQLEQSRNAGGPGRRKSEAVRSPGQLNLVVGSSRRSISMSRVPSRDDVPIGTSGAGLQPRAPPSSDTRARRSAAANGTSSASSTNKASALDNILDFALDDDMARRIRSSLQQIHDQPASGSGGSGLVVGTGVQRQSKV